jgi:hypothetical protein
MGLPIGYDDFAEIRQKNLDFVDKSLFIPEDAGYKVNALKHLLIIACRN